ncbi:hypothetical protein [Aridibaculum aurantiacum]|uniref:hypothetical protein n=1 Tax=Aridibaculum aurantiacum TaxID=2810307 RepID=UPI001A963AC8|nr:hypothetical protein [Aridibaculum aurantiacum]
MKNTFFLLVMMNTACSGTTGETKPSAAAETNGTTVSTTSETAAARHYAGAFSNGMKGDSIFFDVSADGKTLENLTFKGYWRCSGKLEQTTVGPDGAFNINNGKVNDHISEPPDGGSTAWRFDLEADINPTSASGTFRMNINNLGCDTYKLNWTAEVRK